MFRSIVPTVLLAVALTLLLAVPAVGQSGTDLGAQSLGRGYWHVFVAYALAWILVFGWAVSIGRRLSDVERRIDG